MHLTFAHTKLAAQICFHHQGHTHRNLKCSPVPSSFDPITSKQPSLCYGQCFSVWIQKRNKNSISLRSSQSASSSQAFFSLFIRFMSYFFGPGKCFLCIFGYAYTHTRKYIHTRTHLQANIYIYLYFMAG